MKVNYRKGYAEGGFLDDGASVDPVSGNEVPTGSLQEEVRDDVPAQLSEGEFVVPADVVRFIGLEKLMRMRDKAKSGLAHMEEAGQIGGSPVMEDRMPMEMSEMMGEGDDPEMDALIDGMDGEDFEGSIQRFAEGGSVRANLPTYEDYTGREFGKAEIVKHVKYTNADGDIISVATIQGSPINPVPEGYYPVGEPPEVEEPIDEGDETPVDNSGGSNLVEEDANPWKGIYSVSSTDANKNHHQIRSDKVTRDRRVALEDLGEQFKDETSSTMVNKQMQNYMTADALEILNTRGTNKDSWEWSLLKNKTPAERAIWAQKTADTIQRNKGAPDPSYTGAPVGNTGEVGEFVASILDGDIDVKTAVKAVVDFAAGGGITGLIWDKLKDEFGEKEVDGAVVEVAAEEEVTPKETTLEGVAEGAVIKEAAIEDLKVPLAQEVPDRDTKLLDEMSAGSHEEYEVLPWDLSSAETTPLESNSITGSSWQNAKTAPLESNSITGSSWSDDIYATNTATSRIPKITVDSEYDLQTALRDEELFNEVSDRAQNRRDAANRQNAKDAAAKAAADREARIAADKLKEGGRGYEGGTNTGYDNNKRHQVATKHNPNYSQAEKKAAARATDKHWGMAEGGLASKKKPAVKKMRKDPTAGLASKKKSKEKAKAKKGALAAKRT